MKRFSKNLLYGFFHAFSTNGRDSRQTYCDISKALLVLGLISLVLMLWSTGPVYTLLKEWLLLSQTVCRILLGVWLLFLGVTLMCAIMRRWQDLDIRIPPGDSFFNLLMRPRFYEVLSTEEGSRETNKYGPAPKDNPIPIIDEADFKKAIRKKLFVDLYEEEIIK